MLLGNGDGTLAPYTPFPAGRDPYAVVTGDLDGDGRRDLAVANFTSNTASVLIGNGDGTFGMGRSVVTGSYPASVAVGDFNRDAKSDLVTGNLNAGTVSVLLGNGDGTFLPKHDFDAGTNPYSVVVGDFDLDGNPDVAVVNLGPNTAVAMIGGGEVDEIAGTNAVFGFLSVLHGNGDGTFAAPTTWPTVRDPSAVVVTDYERRRQSPILAVTSSSTSAAWIAGNGDGTFALPSGLSSLAAYSVATGDADADGNADLATANFSSNSMSVLRGLGGGLVDTRTYPVGRNPFSVAIGDLDGDGKPDVATANIGSGTSTVLLGNGDGTFGARTELPMGGEPRAVRIGNLGSDAGPALMVAIHWRTPCRCCSAWARELWGRGRISGSRTTLSRWRSAISMVTVGPIWPWRTPPPTPSRCCFSGRRHWRMGVTLDPQTFNLRAMGHWVTAYLEPPAPFTADQIDVSSIRLNGQVSVDPTAPVAIGDHNAQRRSGSDGEVRSRCGGAHLERGRGGVGDRDRHRRRPCLLGHGHDPCDPCRGDRAGGGNHGFGR